jgi:phospholipid/cholesterol/gamma-HCH transport system substrate-binding protein
VKKAIKNYWQFFVAIIGLALIAAGVGGYVLSNQRFYLPHWVPVLGSDFVDYKAELPTAQSITPGQGQTVDVAGVPVGDISRVDLVDGRAVVTMKIRRKFTPIYKDATILVRPKTGLNDMVLELSPGSKKSGELAKNGKSWIPVSQTLPNVNLDELLASLDADTRNYLQLLVGGLGQGLRDNGRPLAADFKRFVPTSVDVLRLSKALSTRHDAIKRTIHNFSKLSQALASKDHQLSSLIDSSNTVFAAFAHQDARLRDALGVLPSTLVATNAGLSKADKLAKALGPTLGALRPTARALGPALAETRPFLRKTTPIIKNQLRPFARDSLPTIKALRPAARDLAAATPDLTDSVKVVNYLTDELAYDKPGDNNNSFLYWFAWANHAADTVFGQGDAHGPTRRGLLVVSCAGLETLDQLKLVNQQLGLLVSLLDPVRTSAVCPATSADPAVSAAARAADAPKLNPSLLKGGGR